MRNPSAFYTYLVVLAATLFCLLASGGARAATLSRDDVVARLRIRADILVMTDDGKRVAEVGDETRLFSGFSPDGKYVRDWSSENDRYGSFKLRHAWTVDPSGNLHVKFEEFSEEERDSKTGEPKELKNPIGSEERDVIDFGAVLYPVKATKGKRVVLRFTPELAPEAKPAPVGKLKLVGRGVAIYDAEGSLWASDLDLDAEYSAISTHRGTLILSYAPFRGSEPAGIASGKKIVLRMKDYPPVTLQSDRDFLPEGANARVFVKYLKGKRTSGLNSVRQYESSNEARILDRLTR